jgi:hypothetical protein
LLADEPRIQLEFEGEAEAEQQRILLKQQPAPKNGTYVNAPLQTLSLCCYAGLSNKQLGMAHAGT